MDFLEFVCVMTVILMSGGLVFVWLSTRNTIILQELAEKRRISAERSKAAKARYEQDNQGDLGDWVPELLQLAGLSPEMLFEDEMPAELKKFLPLVKGFIDSGGLKKMLGGSPGAPGPEDRSAI